MTLCRHPMETELTDFQGTRSLITAFTYFLHWTLSSARAIQSPVSQPTSLEIHFNIILSSTSGLPIKVSFPQVFPLDGSIHATCPAHLSCLYLRFIIMLGEEYNACSSTLCNFLHSPVILSLSQLHKYFIFKHP